MTTRDVYVVATAAVSPFGLDAAALLAGLRGERDPAASSLLAASHPGARAIGVVTVPADRDPVPTKTRKTMSRGAYLGAVALRALVTAAGWKDKGGVGYFLGVGASGGSMSDLEAILAATLAASGASGDRIRGPNDSMSLENSTAPRRNADELDLARFGEAGIPACNPLLAFQLMNNFTMCHGAILEGTTGPSGAFFSRGAGTMTALIEAFCAVAEGDCERAIAGGADSALHPVTWIEHQRLADTAVRLPAGEGAGLIALAAEPDAHAIMLEVAEQVTRADDPVACAAQLVGGCDVVVVGADDANHRDALAAATGGTGTRTVTVDAIGTCLAATPALGWVAAIELLRAGARRAAVVTLDGAGDLAVVMFVRDGGRA